MHYTHCTYILCLPSAVPSEVDTVTVNVLLINPCATTPIIADERKSSSWTGISEAINPTMTLGSEEVRKGDGGRGRVSDRKGRGGEGGESGRREEGEEIRKRDGKVGSGRSA